jgi:hypothetical protein
MIYKFIYFYHENYYNILCELCFYTKSIKLLFLICFVYYIFDQLRSA